MAEASSPRRLGFIRASAVARAERIRYQRAKHQPDLGVLAGRLATHMEHANALFAMGDTIRAAGATLAVNIAALQIASAQSRSSAERDWKLAFLRFLIPTLERAQQTHVACLVEAAETREAAAGPKPVDDTHPVLSSPRTSAPRIDAGGAGIPIEHLDQYWDDALAFSHVGEVLPAIEALRTDLANLESEGRFGACCGARNLLARSLLGLCCVRPSDRDESRAKVATIEEVRAYLADQPLLWAILDASLSLERRTWPDA